MNLDKVAILLSTFNGENYLYQQLDSILNQSYEDFVIYIRDDGSSDGTMRLLHQFKSSDTRIILLNDGLGNIGVAKSYKLLMEFANSDYYLFADQDDIWELNKIETLLTITERSSKKNEPYLLFSNMSIFQENSTDTHDFFEKYKLNNTKIKNGLFQGTISGCLMLFNHKAKQVSLVFNSQSNMLHDWDLMMACYVHGKIELTNNRLVQHRIHDRNVVGENLKKSLLVLFKDFAKYAFRSGDYRKIELNYYFGYVQKCVLSLDNKMRLNKGFLTEDELRKLSYIKRKKWYLKHFNPFIYGRVRGLLILLTI